MEGQGGCLWRNWCELASGVKDKDQKIRKKVFFFFPTVTCQSFSAGCQQFVFSMYIVYVCVCVRQRKKDRHSRA